ncbi:hypothetical protein [Streptomyces sp. NPDC051554]|uniref:hypothetical protein n=1 Tax=Streptomyces sp. NPDC051554 TaxID=3365656 RepID=UPI0037AE79FA
MGAQLVALVLLKWKHLNDTAFRILVRMALTALDHEKDDNPAHLYFGGHELLAMALRRSFPEGDSEQARKARQNILRDVRRSVKELTEQGAIEVVDTGRVVRQGEAKTYRLTLWREGGVLDPSSGGVDTPSSVDHSGGVDTPSSGGVLNPPSGGVLNPIEEGVSTPPRRAVGAREEPREEQRADAGAQPQDARAPETEGDRPSLRSVPTQGVRDPVPPGGGVPGQQPFIASVADPSPLPGTSDDPEDPEAPHGRCGGCQRPLARNRPACLRCGLMIGEVS